MTRQLLISNEIDFCIIEIHPQSIYFLSVMKEPKQYLFVDIENIVVEIFNFFLLDNIEGHFRVAIDDEGEVPIFSCNVNREEYIDECLAIDYELFKSRFSMVKINCVVNDTNSIDIGKLLRVLTHTLKVKVIKTIKY